MLCSPQSHTNISSVSAGGDVEDIDRDRNVFGTEGIATDFFVMPTYRPYQRETIEEIEDAFERGYRQILVDAPTGSGKSHIARAFAFQSGSAHILTVQKLLQDQYLADFKDMFIMKGRGAYLCLRSEYGESCAEGICRRRKMKTCTGCPYIDAKVAASMSPVTVHNFDSFYYQNTFGSGFSGRKLMIVDEAHNISNKFSSFLSFKIDGRGGIEVPECESLHEYDAFVKNAYSDYSIEYGALKAQHEAEIPLSKENLKRMNDLNATIHRMKRFLTERERENPEEYVFDYLPKGRWGPNVTFRPVFVGSYASDWLSKFGDRVLMMSATILDKDMFCKETGLNPDKTYYVQVPSIFPPENRPIIKKYAGNMNYANIKLTLPRIAEIIQEIADMYPGRKGIIQTHSEKIARYLQDHLIDPRFTYNKDFPTPKDMLKAHALKDGSLIIASGLREGLDLQGDLSKIQVFCKIPYPSMGDKLIVRKMELDHAWYGWMTTLMFVQSLGRSVRSPTEKAVTFILDSGFGKFYGMNKKFIPEYIKEAIR